MNPRWNPFWPRPVREAAPDPMPSASQAARTLGAIALKNAADRRTATLSALRECVATGRVAKLGWKA